MPEMSLQEILARKSRVWKTFEPNKQLCNCTFHNFSTKTLNHGGLKNMNVKDSVKKIWHLQINQFVLSTALFPNQDVFFY